MLNDKFEVTFSYRNVNKKMIVLMKFFLVMLINSIWTFAGILQINLHLQFPVATDFTTKSHMVVQ